MEITLNRSRVQEIHEVLKHLMDRRSSVADKALVRTEPGRLSILAGNGDVDVLFQAHQSEITTAMQFMLPLASLGEMAKGTQEVIHLTGEAPVQAEIDKLLTPALNEPKRMHHVVWEPLRQHLRNAGDLVAAGPERYALNRICLRQEGVVATDGQQLYSGNSLHLPIRKGQTCLIVPPRVLTSKTLVNYPEVATSRDDAGVIFKFGSTWMIRLRDHEGRFPAWQELVPRVEDAKAKLVIAPELLPTVQERLRQLLEGTGPGTVVRLAFGTKTLTLLDKDEKEIRSVEMPEAVSTGNLPSIMFDPKFLIAAMRMGFLNVHFTALNKPIVATKGSDIYLWMPCVEEPTAQVQASSSHQENTPMQENKPETPKAEAQPKPEAQPNDINAILAELDAIKDAFRDLVRRVTNVQQSIRQRAADLQKREKAVQQALAGLKQLKELAA